MTIGILLIGTIISQILFVITKVFFIHSLNLDSWVIMTGFYAALVVITIAVVRRMGTLNYIESFFLAFVWLITTLVVDYVILTKFVGWDFYHAWYYWLTHVAVIVALITFHKKLHVQVRKANA